MDTAPRPHATLATCDACALRVLVVSPEEAPADPPGWERFAASSPAWALLPRRTRPACVVLTYCPRCAEERRGRLARAAG